MTRRLPAPVLATLVTVLAGLALVAIIAPDTSAPLTAEQRSIIEQLESVLLHDTATFQYHRVVDHRDGRGYVLGRGDFSTARGEALEVVRAYTSRVGANALAGRYAAALERLAADGSAAHTGLDGFPVAWRIASADPEFRQVQDEVMQARYLARAQATAVVLGIGSPLGIAIMYDSLIQHGDDGGDPDGLPSLIGRTIVTAGGHPGPKIREMLWLAIFLDVRASILANPVAAGHRMMWPYTVGRVHALQRLVADRAATLDPPVSVNPYGTLHMLTPWPSGDAAH